MSTEQDSIRGHQDFLEHQGEEIPQEGWSRDQFRDYLKQKEVPTALALEEGHKDITDLSEVEVINILWVLSDESSYPLESRAIKGAFRELKAIERDVIYQRYWKDRSRIQASALLNMHPSTLGRIEEKALQKIRYLFVDGRIHQLVYFLKKGFSFPKGGKDE